MTVVDASLVIRLLSNRPADEFLRRRLAGLPTLHSPQLIDAEVASGVRGLLLGRKVEGVRLSIAVVPQRLTAERGRTAAVRCGATIAACGIWRPISFGNAC